MFNKKKYIILIILILNILIKCIMCNVYSFDEIDELDVAEDIGEVLETAADVDEKEPEINSRQAIVFDRKSKRIIFGKNENKRVAMASTTKIMTAIIVIENGKLDDEVVVSAKAGGIGGSRLGLKKNDKITVKNLLYGLMLCSGNDAAVALAEYISRRCRAICRKDEQKGKRT